MLLLTVSGCAMCCSYLYKCISKIHEYSYKKCCVLAAISAVPVPDLVAPAVCIKILWIWLLHGVARLWLLLSGVRVYFPFVCIAAFIRLMFFFKVPSSRLIFSGDKLLPSTQCLCVFSVLLLSVTFQRAIEFLMYRVNGLVLIASFSKECVIYFLVLADILNGRIETFLALFTICKCLC